MSNYKELADVVEGRIKGLIPFTQLAKDEHAKIREAAAILRRLDAAQVGVDGVMNLAAVLGSYPFETSGKIITRAKLLAAVEALALGGWQPIETAPEQGELLLAHIQAGKIYWVEAGKRGQGVLKKLFFTLTAGSMPTPTHWMPLPEPPNGALSPSHHL